MRRGGCARRHPWAGCGRIIVVKPGVRATDELASALQRHVKEAIAPDKYPRRITFVETLSRTNTGKLQRFKRREAYGNDVSEDRPERAAARANNR